MKWEAYNLGSEEWIVRSVNSEHGYISIDGTDGYEQKFSEEKAKAYALALNVADAGVDLGEAACKLIECLDALDDYFDNSLPQGKDKRELSTKAASAITWLHGFAKSIDDVVPTIANAVEGGGE